MVVLQDEEDNLPDLNVARDFYSKYEVKEILGRLIPSISGL